MNSMALVRDCAKGKNRQAKSVRKPLQLLTILGTSQVRLSGELSWASRAHGWGVYTNVKKEMWAESAHKRSLEAANGSGKNAA